MAAVNEPVLPPPTLVYELEVVGFCDVLQHTPRSVIVAPPSALTFPPELPPLPEIDVTEVVVLTVGGARTVPPVTSHW